MKIFLSLSWFFAKTLYFSPANNPLFLFTTGVGGLFLAGGSLGKHEVLLMMLAIGLTHRLMPNLHSMPDPGVRHSPQHPVPAIQLLPVSTKKFVWSALAASILFGTIFIGGLSVLLIRAEGMPPYIGDARITSTALDNGDTVKVAVMYLLQSRETKTGFVNEIMEAQTPLSPSLLFGELPGQLVVRPVPVGERIPGIVQDNGAPAKKKSIRKLLSRESLTMMAYALFILGFFIADAIRCYTTFLPGKTAGRIDSVLNSWFLFGYILFGVIVVIDVLLPGCMVRQLTAPGMHLALFGAVAGCVWACIVSASIALFAKRAS